jgi:hypothetical protein
MEIVLLTHPIWQGNFPSVDGWRVIEVRKEKLFRRFPDDVD